MPDIGRRTLQEMAALSGFHLSDDEADRILPNVQAVLQSLGEVAGLDPGDVDTADVFSALGD